MTDYMPTKKIVAKELPPGYIDFGCYFQGDVFRGNIKDGYPVFILGNHHIFNQKKYKHILEMAGCICYEMLDAIEGRKGANPRNSIEQWGLKYTKELHGQLEKWAVSVRDNNGIFNGETIVNYLTIITGMEWKTISFTGYVQGDYCTILYCVDWYSDAAINEIGKMYLGCGTEFEIDGTIGYFVIDTIVWDGGDVLRNKLAELYGCKPEELEIFLFDGYKETPIYKQV